MEVILRIENIIAKDNKLLFSENNFLLSFLFENLIKFFFTEKIFLIKEYPHSVAQITADNDFYKAMKSLKNGTYILSSTQNNDSFFSININLYANNLGLVIYNNSLNQTTFTTDYLAFLKNFTIDFYKQLGSSYQLSKHFGIEVYGINYQKSHPPRDLSNLGETNVIDFMILNYKNYFSENDISLLINHQLPKNVRRTKIDNLLIIEWISNLNDKNSISKRLQLRQIWFGKILNLPIKTRYNIHGDKQEILLKKSLDANFTFYDPIMKIGYRTTLPSTANKLDDYIIEEIKALISYKNNSINPNIQKIGLIVPNRETAVILSKEIKLLGIDKLLYLDDDANFWNLELF